MAGKVPEDTAAVTAGAEMLLCPMITGSALHLAEMMIMPLLTSVLSVSVSFGTQRATMNSQEILKGPL